MKYDATRRGFLGGAAGIISMSATSLGSAVAAVSESAVPFRLGLATYSLRSFDRPTAIKMLKEMPIHTISIKDFHLKLTSSPAEIEAAKKEFEAAGITVVSAGNITLKSEENIKQAMEYAKALGIKTIVCAPTHAMIGPLEKAIKEYDIKAAIHNHGPEDKEFPTPQSVLDVCKGKDARLGLCMDIGHSARTGVDVVKSIAEAGSRLLDMHVKDLKDLKAKDSQVACGDGAMPFPAIFKQLIKMGYKGNVNLEYEINAKDPMMGIQKSFSYMRGVIAGIKG